MSVTAFPPSAPTCWRVYRAWDNRRQVHQHYIPFGRNKEKSRQRAELLDQRLAARQRAFQLRLEITGDRWINQDGTIVGLKRRTRTRLNSISDLFIIQASVTRGEKQVKKEISISALGFDLAFSSAISAVAELYEIDRRSLAFGRFVEARSAYETASTKSTTTAAQISTKPSDALEIALLRSATEFRQRQARGVISNRY